ncbi:MAG: patatin-like phospholipase family protein [Lachnospiraceae bacterium]|nr:patatin-like phospholipase family protein [Lachnospiraceae bacterium]
MRFQLDLTKEYGIVLEGGGARGSYQIGAWKALREAGIKIRGIAGASVGALNGALICMDDLEKAEEIWENIRYSQVIDVDDDVIETVKKLDLKSLDLVKVAEDAKRILKDKGLDITPLKNLIESVVDEDKIRSSDRELYLTTYSVTDRELLVLNAKDIPDGEIGDMLLASAYFPAFRNDKLGGKRYLDGGGWNNVPINILLEHDYKDILVIRIYGLGYDSERTTEIPEDVHVTHIAPRQDLGGMLEFDRTRARKNMTLGYYDAKRVLYGLEGRWYYLYAPESDVYYFERFLTEIEEFTRCGLLPMPEQIPEELSGYRIYTEQVFPFLAQRMKLKKNWTYKELYLSFLEDTARSFRISRFHIYTPAELKQKINEKCLLHIYS